MIAVIDYGVGNLFSVETALIAAGGEVTVTNDANAIKNAAKLVLPGVGAFGDCMRQLEATNLVEVIKNEVANGKPLLGICVGLQLLFEESEESEGVQGLSLLSGKIKKIEATDEKIPHMGWNSLDISENAGKINLFKGLSKNPYVYFVHSFHAVCDANLISATCEYGGRITAAVQKNNVVATQFHPEKSGDVGIKILKNFVEG
ncbi:MAG: imidazole glycerol phosphate synthase subunit HisH [Selenomonadaceae bacterium]|nr:imidazole glycerol phosphate synthase subunit HisH [Selenomonadaceae bacterium]